MNTYSHAIARGAVAALLVLFAATAHSADVDIHWTGTIAGSDITFNGEFSFPTDDPDAALFVDLLAEGANTDVVVSDGNTSKTWNLISPSLEFIYCPGGVPQCGIAAPGSFVASTMPGWGAVSLGNQLFTDCEPLLGFPVSFDCEVFGLQFDQTDPASGVMISNVGFYHVDFAFELVPTTPNPNEAPVAEAGPDQSARVGDNVTLLGSGSDDNTAAEDLQYAWSFYALPAASNAVLVDSDTPSPSFQVDVAGQYDIALVVTDAEGSASAPDFVVVSSNNLAPTADAGAEQIVLVGSTTNLDGSGSSDPENDPLIYSWTLSGPAGSSAPLAGANTDSASFVPDVAGVYLATLNVSDFIGPGTPDTVEVTASTAEQEQFAEMQLLAASSTVAALGTGEVRTYGNQAALLNFLAQAIVAIQEGDLAEAIDKLEKAITRTDGCALSGMPDVTRGERDWITDCAAQSMVYPLLNSALDALTQ